MIDIVAFRFEINASFWYTAHRPIDLSRSVIYDGFSCAFPGIHKSSGPQWWTRTDHAGLTKSSIASLDLFWCPPPTFTILGNGTWDYFWHLTESSLRLRSLGDLAILPSVNINCVYIEMEFVFPLNMGMFPFAIYRLHRDRFSVSEKSINIVVIVKWSYLCDSVMFENFYPPCPSRLSVICFILGPR